ncbi:response regulator [Catenovulum sp. SM1970]|uniref:response regulator n=1 Tax=Marinifaba aquimaris TaxID=2741323 RepID=UPI0015749281|nr:response regulator [Marinifaba aquimaris]NTS76683.1 response regulator [Marinifaba aquimaris]
MSENSSPENARILIIEDDIELADLIATYLSNKQFTVDVINEGISAVDRIVNEQPDLVILDLMLPGKDGISICREARYSYLGAILILTASEDDIDQILGLEIGADDFVQKPVEPRVLLARVRALLRRFEQVKSLQSQQSSKAEVLKFGQLSINLSARTVKLANVNIELTSPEFDVLTELAKDAGTTLSRDELFKRLKNLNYDGQNRFIDITISQIRKKLGEDAELYLKTVRGQGYLFVVND